MGDVFAMLQGVYLVMRFPIELWGRNFSFMELFFLFSFVGLVFWLLGGIMFGK